MREIELYLSNKEFIIQIRILTNYNKIYLSQLRMIHIFLNNFFA